MIVTMLEFTVEPEISKEHMIASMRLIVTVSIFRIGFVGIPESKILFQGRKDR